MPKISGWGEFRISWHILLASALGVGLGSALNHYASNIFGPALIKEFGWTKAELALSGVTVLINVVCFPIAGRFIDKYGARNMAMLGFTVIPLTYVLYTLMTGALWQYYAITIIHQIFAIFTATLVFAKVIVAKFDRARGIALSLLMTGAPLASWLLIPVLGNIIQTSGWRTGYLVMAGLAFAAGLIALFTISNAPAKPKRPQDELSLQRFRALSKQPAFPMMFAGMLLCNVPQILVAGQLNLMMLDNGATVKSAVWLASLYPISVIIGRLCTGLALDRVSSSIVALFALGLPAIGYFALALPVDPFWLLSGTVILIGLAQGAEGDLGAYIAAHKFGTEDFSFVYSFMFVAMALGSAAGAALLSLTLKSTGSYDIFLIIATITTIFGALAFVLAGRNSEQDENRAAASG